MSLTAYVFNGIKQAMTWPILFDETFEDEFRSFAIEVQDELMARAGLLAEIGPSLGRPSVDTLKGSKHTNMKELRFSASDGVWRVAFAFDPKRQAILLVAGDKSGTSQKRFYRDLISKADDRFSRHLQRTEG